MTRGPSRARGLAGLRKRGRAAVLWTAGTFLLAQAGLGTLAHTALPQLRDPMYFDKEGRPRLPGRPPGGPGKSRARLRASRMVPHSTTSFECPTGRPLRGRVSA